MTYRDNRGRACNVCNHERRAEMELRLANGTPLRIVAAKYGLGYDSCYRHKKNHMPPELIA
jgi:hypothetical protein